MTRTTVSRIKTLGECAPDATRTDQAFVLGGVFTSDEFVKHRILHLIHVADVIHVSDMAFIIGYRAKLNGSKLDSAGLIRELCVDPGLLTLTDDGVKELDRLREIG